MIKRVWTHEEILQLEGRELDAALALVAFGFEWWAGHAYGGMGTLHRGLFPEKPEHIKGIRPATGEEPLYSDWHWQIPKLSSWAGQEQVVGRLKELGWYWQVDQRIRPTPLAADPSELEWFAAFRQRQRNEEGYFHKSRVRAVPAPDHSELRIATARAALWVLMPWEENHDA